MTQVLRGNIIQAPRLGELDIREHGYLVLEDGVNMGYGTHEELLAAGGLYSRMWKAQAENYVV